RSRPATGEVASGRERRDVSQAGYPSVQARHHLLGGLGEALLLLLAVGLPGRERPDLDPIERADHGALPGQVRVGAPLARDGYAALLIRDDVPRSGQQHPQVVTAAPIGGGRPTGFLELLAELGERVHGDAVLLSASHDQSRGELVTELRRK